MQEEKENLIQVMECEQNSRPLFKLIPETSEIQLGLVSFDCTKKPINKGVESALQYLSEFYPRQYVKRSVNKIFVDKKNNNANQQIIEKINNNPQRYFPLQSVFDYHMSIVKSTTQQKFIINKSDFTIKFPCNIENLKEKVFWKVNFTSLKIMDLSNCGIVNIEGLSYCHIPVVEQLKLDTNKIVSIKCLSKCEFKQLKQLSTYDNPLLKMQTFSRIECPNLQKLQLEKLDRPGMIFLVNPFPRRKDWDFEMQSLDFIVKAMPKSQLKQMMIDFSDIIQPKWYEGTMKKIDASMKIFTKQQSRLRQFRQQNLNDFGFQFLQDHVLMPPINEVENQQERIERRNRVIGMRNQRFYNRINNLNMQRLRRPNRQQ